jgi:hypothetical protein
MNDLAVLVGLISFPGLIATVICDKLVVHAERWTSFKYSIYTFIFGVGSYAVLQFLTWITSLVGRHLPFLSESASLGLWSTLSSGHDLHFSEVAWATGLSPFIALAAVYSVNKKHMTRFAQWLGISNKYGDENLFSYFLNSPDVQWVYLRDPANGFTYMGAVSSFSEAKAVQEITLTDVTVYSYEDSDLLYRLDSIYLSRPLGTFTIESPNSAEGESSNEKGTNNSATGGSGARPSKGRRDKRNKSASAPAAAAASTQEEVK